MIAGRVAILLAVQILISAALSDRSGIDNVVEIATGIAEDHIPFINPMINEDFDYLKNLMENYRRHIKPRLGIEFNTPQDQGTYKVLKRNADIINTLLGFPRRMVIAGR